jgi:hypothetical protein
LAQLVFWIETSENDFGFSKNTLIIPPPLPSPEGEIYLKSRCAFDAKRRS